MKREGGIGHQTPAVDEFGENGREEGRKEDGRREGGGRREEGNRELRQRTLGVEGNAARPPSLQLQLSEFLQTAARIESMESRLAWLCRLAYTFSFYQTGKAEETVRHTFFPAYSHTSIQPNLPERGLHTRETKRG